MNRTRHTTDQVLNAGAAAGGVLAAGWLAATWVPAVRETMLDMVLAFLLSLCVAGLLWRLAARSPARRRTWGLLAGGWTAGILGTLAWGLYEVLTGRQLPYMSPADLFFALRYALVLAALAGCLAPWTRRRWAGLAGAGTAALAVTWLFLFRPALAATDPETGYFLAGALFPLFDILIVILAAWATLRARPGPWRGTLALLLLSLAVYATATWLQFSVRLPSYELTSALASYLWTASDIVAWLAAALGIRAMDQPAGSMAAQGRQV